MIAKRIPSQGPNARLRRPGLRRRLAAGSPIQGTRLGIGIYQQDGRRVLGKDGSEVNGVCAFPHPTPLVQNSDNHALVLCLYDYTLMCLYSSNHGKTAPDD